jgi:hypothetical protein
MIMTSSSCASSSNGAITINLAQAWFWWKISGIGWLILAFFGFVFLTGYRNPLAVIGFVPIVIFAIWLITILIRGLFW